MSEHVNFDLASAKRIGKSTLIVERLQRNNPTNFPVNVDTKPIGIWGKITHGEGGKYSWVAVESVSGSFVNKSEWGSGDYADADGYAFEVNENDVPDDVVVWLIPARVGDGYRFNFSYIDSLIKSGTTAGVISSGSTGTVNTGFEMITVRNIYSQNAEDGLACHIAKVGNEWHLISLDCVED